MIIKVLGPGCSNCKRLKNNVEVAVKELELNASIEKVTDFKEITKYGVMSTPALVVDDEIKVAGKVAKVDEIKVHLQ
ncbi:thioredoxin family protein [Paraliobacillus sp. JSM ZJ581]|uniref:thioredoxin family protein n=1 Tax=Paraliobacillus sp. JSM ZJ581 TaxID=3342118 RepID=UPI0035A8E0AE